MPAAEDRQARALEGIQRHLGQLVKIHETLNVNLVAAIKMFEDFTALLETVQAEAEPETFLDPKGVLEVNRESTT